MHARNNNTRAVQGTSQVSARPAGTEILKLETLVKLFGLKNFGSEVLRRWSFQLTTCATCKFSDFSKTSPCPSTATWHVALPIGRCKGTHRHKKLETSSSHASNVHTWMMSNLLISFHKHSAFSACQADGIMTSQFSRHLSQPSCEPALLFSLPFPGSQHLRPTYKRQAFGVPTCRLPTFHSAPGVKHHRFTTNLWAWHVSWKWTKPINSCADVENPPFQPEFC